MKYKILLLLLLVLDVGVLFFESSWLSISSAEAYLLYHESGLVTLALNGLLHLFGNSDLTLRAPFILLHIADIFLIYAISKRYLKTERERLWLLLVFVLLPGVISSAVVASDAGFLIFGLLLYIYLQPLLSKYTEALLLLLFAMSDGGFAYLFLALFIYFLAQKKELFALYVAGLYFINIYLYGFDIHGYPRGHFLDTLALYSAILTPVIFLYIVYVLYRRFLARKRDRLWYIATTALFYSLLLSFRQRVEIEHFAPYLIVALPLAAESFASSYRVRLREHRRGYRTIFGAAFVLLLLNALFVFFSRELYLVVENPKKNFIYNMDIAKELASQLRKKNITCIETNEKMQRRLHFYGIKKCDAIKLQELPLTSNAKSDVTIRYKGRVLYRADVTKLNNK